MNQKIDPSFIASLIPLIRIGADLVKELTANNGRAPTDEEISASLVQRNEAEITYLQALAAKRAS